MNASASSLPHPASVSLARRLRKRIGKVKYVLFGEWPYLPLVRIARRRRMEQRPLLLQLPTVRHQDGPECEVHMLCGHRDADMGVWATWSLLRFLPSAALIVHSDGSLTEDDQSLWRRVSHQVTFTKPSEREARAEELRTAFPAVHKWRTVHGCGSKFVDFHLFGRARRLLLLDSDVLCFSEPRELLESLTLPTASMRWNADITTSYAATPAQLSAILGFPVPARVNSGFLLTKRWDRDDLAYLDGMLDTLLRNGVPIYEWWAEQMMYATMASRHGTAQSFPDGYSVVLGRTSPRSVVRHYVGVPRIRPRFHTEGIPRLLAQLAATRATTGAEPPLSAASPISRGSAQQL